MTVAIAVAVVGDVVVAIFCVASIIFVYRDNNGGLNTV